MGELIVSDKQRYVHLQPRRELVERQKYKNIMENGKTMLN